MKSKKSAGTGKATAQLSLDFSKAACTIGQKARLTAEARSSAEIVGLAQFRSAKNREVLIADLYKSRVPK
jgi:hypothetical protein